MLLAAGASVRFGRPKQLEPLGPMGAPLPAYTVIDALRAGFERVVVVVRPEMESPMGEQLLRALGPDAPLGFVHQTLDDLPAGRHPPSARERPWGTAHAVTCAGPALADRPFGVANADDWYGPEALSALAGFLAHASGGEGCLVGYPVESTLSAFGGVSRGRVRTDGDRVTDVIECRNVRAEGDRVHGTGPDDAPVEFTPGERVSMNLWGLPAGTPDLLATRMEAFFAERTATGRDDGEFLLSRELGALVRDRRLGLRLLDTGRRWFGLTHPRDAEEARARLAALHRAGTYDHGVYLQAGGAPCN